MEAEKKTIVVVGATGRQGSAVIKHLLNSGSFRVRALTRNARAARAEHLRALGVKLLEASLDDSAGLERSLEGADGVFSIQNYWEKGGSSTSSNQPWPTARFLTLSFSDTSNRKPG